MFSPSRQSALVRSEKPASLTRKRPPSDFQSTPTMKQARVCAPSTIGDEDVKQTAPAWVDGDPESTMVESQRKPTKISSRKWSSPRTSIAPNVPTLSADSILHEHNRTTMPAIFKLPSEPSFTSPKSTKTTSAACMPDVHSCLVTSRAQSAVLSNSASHDERSTIQWTNLTLDTSSAMTSSTEQQVSWSTYSLPIFRSEETASMDVVTKSDTTSLKRVLKTKTSNRLLEKHILQKVPATTKYRVPNIVEVGIASNNTGLPSTEKSITNHWKLADGPSPWNVSPNVAHITSPQLPKNSTDKRTPTRIRQTPVQLMNQVDHHIADCGLPVTKEDEPSCVSNSTGTAVLKHMKHRVSNMTRVQVADKFSCRNDATQMGRASDKSLRTESVLDTGAVVNHLPSELSAIVVTASVPAISPIKPVVQHYAQTPAAKRESTWLEEAAAIAMAALGESATERSCTYVAAANPSQLSGTAFPAGPLIDKATMSVITAIPYSTDGETSDPTRAVLTGSAPPITATVNLPVIDMEVRSTQNVARFQQHSSPSLDRPTSATFHSNTEFTRELPSRVGRVNLELHRQTVNFVKPGFSEVTVEEPYHHLMQIEQNRIENGVEKQGNSKGIGFSPPSAKKTMTDISSRPMQSRRSLRDLTHNSVTRSPLVAVEVKATSGVSAKARRNAVALSGTQQPSPCQLAIDVPQAGLSEPITPVPGQIANSLKPSKPKSDDATTHTSQHLVNTLTLHQCAHLDTQACGMANMPPFYSPQVETHTSAPGQAPINGIAEGHIERFAPNSKVDFVDIITPISNLEGVNRFFTIYRYKNPNPVHPTVSDDPVLSFRFLEKRRKGTFQGCHVSEIEKIGSYPTQCLVKSPPNANTGDKFLVSRPVSLTGFGQDIFVFEVPGSFLPNHRQIKAQYIQRIAPGCMQSKSDYIGSRRRNWCKVSDQATSQSRIESHDAWRKSPGKKWHHYNKTSSRVGTSYQVSTFPSCTEWQQGCDKQESFPKGYGILWDCRKAKEADVVQEGNVFNYLEKDNSSSRFKKMEILHNNDYNVNTAYSVDCDDPEDTQLTKLESETFERLFIADNGMPDKSFLRIARMLGTSVSAVLIHYYGTFKATEAYENMKCRQARESEWCSVCADGGGLVNCDKCNRWYHPKCIGLTKKSIPRGEWFCHDCNNNIGNQGVGALKTPLQNSGNASKDLGFN